MASRASEQIQDLHESIDSLLDRLDSIRPQVDEKAFAEFERRIAFDLDHAYARLYRRVQRVPDRCRARALLLRTRDLARRVQRLRAAHPGSASWWIRMSELEHRLRRHFCEVENELLPELERH